MRVIHYCQKWPFTDWPKFLGEACSFWTKSSLENVISIFLSFLFSGGGGGSFPNNLNQILGWSRMSSSWFTFLSNQSNILYVSAIKLVSQSDQTDIVQQSFHQNNLCFHYHHIVFVMCQRVFAKCSDEKGLTKVVLLEVRQYLLAGIEVQRVIMSFWTLSESPLISLLWMEREAEKW